MTKQEKLEAIRKKVIMACHPGKTYEEALEKELTHGCEVRSDLINEEGRLIVCGLRKGLYEVVTEFSYKTYNYILASDEFQIVGLPASLPRVMAAMDKEFVKYTIYSQSSTGEEEFEIAAQDEAGHHFFRFKWQLLKEDGSENDLSGQSEESIDKLYSLICKAND